MEKREGLIDPVITDKVKSGFSKFVAGIKKVGSAVNDESQWEWLKEDQDNKKTE